MFFKDGCLLEEVKGGDARLGGGRSPRRCRCVRLHPAGGGEAAAGQPRVASGLKSQEPDLCGPGGLGSPVPAAPGRGDLVKEALKAGRSLFERGRGAPPCTPWAPLFQPRGVEQVFSHLCKVPYGLAPAGTSQWGKVSKPFKPVTRAPNTSGCPWPGPLAKERTPSW